MANLELQNELLDIQTKGKTGKLQIIGKLENIKLGATLDCNEGKLVRIRLGRKSGQEAAVALPDIKIERIVFIKSNGLWEKPEPGTPELGFIIEEAAGHDTTFISNNLVQTIIDKLDNSMGKGAQNLVDKVSAKYSPRSNPEQFLQKCRDAASSAIGEKQADKIFASLLFEKS
jgi:hypothetical protein